MNVTVGNVCLFGVTFREAFKRDIIAERFAVPRSLPEPALGDLEDTLVIDAILVSRLGELDKTRGSMKNKRLSEASRPLKLVKDWKEISHCLMEDGLEYLSVRCMD